MYKLGLEKAEEPEIKLSSFTGSQRKQDNSRKTSTSASLTRLRALTLWITINWKTHKEMGVPDHHTSLFSRETCMRIKQQKLKFTFNSGLVQSWERSTTRLYIVTLLIYLICRVHHKNAGLDEAQAGIKMAKRNINCPR